MNIQESAKVLYYLKACYPNVDLDTEATATVWAEEFAHESIEKMMAVARQHMREGNKFFPSVPELLAILNAERVINPGDVWDEIRRSIGSGIYSNLSPIANATIDELGGVQLIRMAQLDDIHRRLPRAVATAQQRIERANATQRPALDADSSPMLEDGYAGNR